MGNIDLGVQTILWNYQNPATSASFNRLARSIFKPGVYKGGLFIPGVNTVSIAPFSAWIKAFDSDDNKAIHLETDQNVVITVPNVPDADWTIYSTYEYSASLNNYADFDIRLTSSGEATNELRFGRVINDSFGNVDTVSYSNRSRGSIDVNSNEELTTDVDPTQDYHVGSRLYNDLRHVKKTGASNYDIEVINSADGTQSSKMVAANTAARIYTFPDRSITFAGSYQAMRVGMIVPSLEQITPAADAPWFDINQEGAVLASNWTTLSPFLRALYGTVLGTTDFSITSISTSGSPVTVTFANNATNDAFLLALNEEQLYHGSFTNFRTLTLTSDIGSLAAGTYGIQGISTGSRTVTLTATNSGSTAAGTVRYYPFRQPDAVSSTNAYWWQVNDAVLRTVGGNAIPYLRVRDRLQGFSITAASQTNNLNYAGPTPATDGLCVDTTHLPVSDGTNGTPRTGLTTRDRSMVGYYYIFGGTYV